MTADNEVTDTGPTPSDPGATNLGRRVRASDAPPDGPSDVSATHAGVRRRDPQPARSSDTRLGRRGRTDSPEQTDTPEDTTEAAPELERTSLGRRASRSAGEAPATTTPERTDDGVIRFGPGVPRSPAASPEWSSARPAPTRRRRRPWIGGLITVALVAGVLAYLLTRAGNPIQAHAEQVTAASAAGACDSVVDVVGTIATNGRPGTVTYQWIRNDGQPTSVLTQSVPDGATSTQVHLQWSFSGHGRFDARATLRVLEPSPASETTGAFTYSCS